MSIPTPAVLKKQLDSKRVSAPTPPVETSHHASSETSVSTHPSPNGSKTQSEKAVPPKKPFKRTEHLSQKPLAHNEDLQNLQENLRAIESVKKSEGKYDRNRNGKQAEAVAKRRQDVAKAMGLKAKGLSNVAIGQEMGIAESSVRSLLKPSPVIQKTVDFLKSLVDPEFIIDVGPGASDTLGISKVQLHRSLEVLRNEGYKVYFIPVGRDENKVVSIKVLAAPGSSYKSVSDRKNEVFMAVKKNKENNW